MLDVTTNSVPDAITIGAHTQFNQKWICTAASWANQNKDTGLFEGLTPKFWAPREIPEDAVLRKIFWDGWAVREMYEQVGCEYFLFLCSSVLEVKSVLAAMKGGLEKDGSIWWPTWSTFGDKGNHIVFTRFKEYPQWWLEKLGIGMNLKLRGDRFWKAMKRYRRATSACAVPGYSEFGAMKVVTVERNWLGREGWTMYRLHSPITDKEFTVLVRPMIKGADGQSFCLQSGPKSAWNMDLPPLDLLSLGGLCEIGAIKGHCLVVTPQKELPADFVISDPKDEIFSKDPDVFYLNVQSHCHRSTVMRTDSQSILHFGFEPFLAEMVAKYLDSLKDSLTDPKKALHMLNELTEDYDEDDPKDDNSAVLNALAKFVHEVPFSFYKIPYFFRLLVNTKMAGLRSLSGNNDRNAVRVPMPRDWATRRYIAVWEDVIDETGLETDPETRLIKPGECLLAHHPDTEIATWRQPNGYWRYNMLHSMQTLWFVAIYGESFLKWLAKSPAIFVTSHPTGQKQMLENWDGADFDDNVGITWHPPLVDNFRNLRNTPYPSDSMPRPDPAETSMNVPEKFNWTWSDLMPFITKMTEAKGIGHYCNRWMTYNYFLRLGMQQPEKYSYLLTGVFAPMHVLGNHSEVIIDSHAKFGGMGLDLYDKIIADFDKELQFLSPFFYWTGSDGETKSRMSQKTVRRILNHGHGNETTPIDTAVAQVKDLCTEFDSWANETYRTLPATWGDDPILFGMEAFYQPQSMRQAADFVRENYAKHFAFTKDKKERQQQFADAFSWLRSRFEHVDAKQMADLLGTLFHDIYSEVAKQDPDDFNRYRFRSEDLLWNPAVIDHMLWYCLYFAKDQKPQLPLTHQFLVMFDLNRKVRDGEITMEQVQKWAALGVNRNLVTIRPGEGKMNVYLPTQSRGDVLIGYTSDRNALRAFQYNNGKPVVARLAPQVLKDGSVSLMGMFADVQLAEAGSAAA